MLNVLRLKNFILIQELELELTPGLNVLTGETGAGKSIVVGALGLVLGGRASADQVRPGADEAEIEALFDLGGRDLTRSPALARLRESGILAGDDLVVRRVVSASGRSRAYLNGRLSTAAELAALAPELADVASQHESVALTDPSTHLEHLDRFAELVASREKMAEVVVGLEALVRSIADLRALAKTRAEREAFVRYQLGGIADVAPRAGETEDLANERKRLRHMTRLIDLVRRAASALDGDGGACDLVARTAADLRAAADLDAELAPVAATVASCLAELREAGSAAERYVETAEADPTRLEQIEERLYKLEGLLRQHGPTIDDLLAAKARLEAELDGLAGADDRLAAEQADLDERLPRAGAQAKALSVERKAAAARLGEAISAELGALGMGGARVTVEVEPAPSRETEGQLSVDGARLSRDGIDRVEFLISPNKGIDPKPLRKIASGGELSRALLALKRVLAESGPAGLYVFDEVDTGVGGAVAERIGSAIADVASHHQVLCITHLAPIAAFASTHFVVSKSTDKAITESRVDRVADEARVREVARMLAGAKVTAAAIEAARELIVEAESARAARAKSSPSDGRAEKSKRSSTHEPRGAKADSTKRDERKPTKGARP
ncbi:MAG TPA: DNA repair protein RecN [Polyangiaceae bacterium]|nr:DNA repair protein RecN [Polyangiaceae bacterium]